MGTEDLYLQRKYGNTGTIAEMEKQLDEMKKEKERLLASYTWPTEPNYKKGLYRIRVKDSEAAEGRKWISAKTVEELKEKVYLHDSGAGITFLECFEAYKKEYLLYKNGDKLKSAKKTVRRMENDVEGIISKTRLPNLPIKSVNEDVIKREFLVMFITKPIRKKAFDAIYSVISNVFKFAYRTHLIKSNPMDFVPKNMYKDMFMRSSEIASRAHSKEEFDRILAYVHEYQHTHPSYLGAYALELVMVAGLRRGEAPPLRWNDVNLDHKALWICRSQKEYRNEETNKNEFYISTVKNEKNRMIPFDELIDDFFRRFEVMTAEYYPGNVFLFPADTPTGCITNNVVYNFYRRACKSLGIPFDRDAMKGTHSFRRNLETRIINNTKGDFEAAASIVGNSVPVTKEHYYCGPEWERLKAAMNAKTDY